MRKKGFVGRLVKALYGTRSAPQAWQHLVRETLIDLGFRPSKVVPSLYYNVERDLRVCTHVDDDDFLCSGRKDMLMWFRKSLEDRFELKRF